MKNKARIKRLTRISLAAALMCVIAPLSLPLGVFPLTLSSFCLYLVALGFRPLDGVLTVLIYLSVGFLGLPVFSGFTGGAQVLVSPTGGFLVSYIPAVFVASLIASASASSSAWRRGTALLAGMLLLYVGGSIGYLFTTGTVLDASLFLLLLPFLFADLLKMVAALVVFTHLAPFLKKTS